MHLAATANRLPNKVALLEGSGRRTTYGELWRAATSLASFLQREATVMRGDVVAISTAGTFEFVTAMYGALRAGATVAALNPLFGVRDMAARLQDVRPKIVIASPETRETLAEIVEEGTLRSPERVLRLEDVGLIAADQQQPPEAVRLDVDADLALLGHTSGTGGLPKAVPHTHAGQTASVRQRAATGRGGESSIVLGFHPLWFTIQLTVFSGATCVDVAGLDAVEVLDSIERERVSEIFGRPFSIETLVSAYDRRARDLSSVHLVETSGSALHHGLAEAAAQRFGCALRQAYHLSEATGSVNRTLLHEVNAETVGYPVPDTEERIVDPESCAEMPIGEIGELFVRGPQVASGYWQRPEETAETFLAEGWLRTGDIVRQDTDGRVYVVDRAKDMMKVYGRNVAPAEIEVVLREHPLILDAAVIGVPSPEGGEIPKAFVVLSGTQEVAPAELAAFVSARLAPYKTVQHVEFVTALPKGPGGKVLRRALAERARAGDLPPHP
ncbi:MAG: hypothetical protein HW416_2263 [Chloroflexi bacterium]|nr:hypothetical protein [Chloroflexota bacterium]